MSLRRCEVQAKGEGINGRGEWKELLRRDRGLYVAFSRVCPDTVWMNEKYEM